MSKRKQPTSSTDTLERCTWAQADPLLRHYHDTEWGVPLRDSRALWETLMLEGFQAGLSWLVILRKRDAFRRAFAHFDPATVAAFTESDILRLLDDPGIVRSRAKIKATIVGAKIYLDMQAAGDDFAAHVWGLAGNQPGQSSGPVATQTPLSRAISRDLRRRGFKFVGPVITYAWMQAVGLINDHAPHCFRHLAVSLRLNRQAAL